MKLSRETAADQKRSCGYAPQIQELINSKMGTGTYLLDKDHMPIYPDFEDNTVVMDENRDSKLGLPGSATRIGLIRQ